MNSSISQTDKAMADLSQGILQHRVWLMLGWQDIKQRYRRSVLGPFWLTLSTGVLIGAMGPLYGKLLGQPISDYVPYIAASMITWFFINTLISEACQVFISAEGHIKQTRVPLSLFIFRLIWRNFLIFLHNIVILIPVYLLTPTPINWNSLLVLLGIFLLLVNFTWMGLMFGILCARFRDIPQIIASLLTIAFFMTPIFWKAEMLGDRRWIAEYNPLYHLVDIVRAPLLGMQPSLYSWMFVTILGVCGMTVAGALFIKFRARIAYWV